MTHLTIRLLGPFEITLNGERKTAFHSDKERALLAYLCLETEVPHRREKLAGLLWPDYPESTARTNLRNALANLRKVIGDRPQNPGEENSPNFLHVTRQTIQFNLESNAWVDVLTFLSTLEKSLATVVELEAAVASYRDDFMAGFSLADSNLFEEWLVIQRERFRRLAFDTLYRLVEAYTTQGEYKQALSHARRMVALDPFREYAQQMFMRLLTYNGQSNQALVQYEKYARLLADEIGVEPLDETTLLYEQIRDGTLKTPQSDTVNLPAFLKYEDDTKKAKSFFVGFEDEMTRLYHFLNQTQAGLGQVVFILGEAGSGKSVLANEFLERAMTSKPNLLTVKGRCNAYTGFGDPYLPFLEIMKMLTGAVETKWAGGEVSRQHAQRLWRSMPDVLGALLKNGPDLIDRLLSSESLLARARAGAPDQAAQLAELVNRSAAAEAANLQQIDLFEQVTNVLCALSQKHPLILLVDDLQWADPGSISLLFHLGRRLSGGRILLIGAYRPEEIAIGRQMDTGQERHPLAPVIHELQRQYGEIIIDLDKTEGRKFIDAFIDSEPNYLPDDFREVLFQHTRGHPLFTVELLRGLQSRGELIRDESGRWQIHSSLNWQFLPPRVEAVIAERISRLPSEWQSILSAASVEGEAFTAEIIAQVLKMDESQMLGCLSGPLIHKHHLAQAQDLEWLGDQRLSHYRFRHFLFQKYLYDKLDPVQRSHLHQAVGVALESLHGEEAGKSAVSLARHFEQAGMTVKAVEYLLQAGERATTLFANEEAIAHFRHGIELVKTLGDTPQRNQLELALQLALGFPLTATHGFSGEELARTYGRARELTRGVEASPELYQTLAGLKAYYDVHGDFWEAKEIAEELLRIASQLKDPGLTALAHHHIGVTLLYLGKPSRFVDHRMEMVSLYDSERDRSLVFQSGIDAHLASLNHAGYAYCFLGYPDKAKEHSQQAVNLAREWGNPFLLSFALMFAAYSAFYRHDLETAHEMAQQTIANASEHGHPLWLGGGFATLGWALGKEGKLEDGIAHIQRGQEILKTIGAWLPYTSDLSLLAETYLKAKKIREGLAVIDEAFTNIRKMGGWVEEPEINRLQGELLLLEKGHQTEAEACFKTAIAVAKEQKAKSWELRATMSLCRLLQKHNKREQARTQLLEIYNWFTEGFDTPDLQEAKALLEALS